MKRTAVIFAFAVFIPALVLGGLALRSLRDQRFAFERQRLQLAQDAADGLARALASEVDELQRDFGRQAEAIIGTNTPAIAAWSFDEQLREVWPLAEVGFSVRLGAEVCSPSVMDNREASRSFHRLNRDFLTGVECVEVFAVTPKGRINLSAQPTTPAPLKQQVELFRNVAPVQGIGESLDPLKSRLQTSAADFKQLVGDAQEGVVARRMPDRLDVLIWHRSARDSQVVFGAQLDRSQLIARLAPRLQTEPAFGSEFAVALLDERVQPLVRTPTSFTTASWRRPFAASEVGEALPHWEVAVYELDPSRPAAAATTFRWTFGSMIAGLLAAIAVGGWLVVQETRRELLMARRKTDFVSNVSHELKTPLTSIRMFAELLAEDRVTDPVRRRQHLEVIATESARLTRLVDGVLDFARLDRGGATAPMQSLDFSILIRDILVLHETRLRSSGIEVKTRLPEDPVIIRGNADALAQIIVNLISNVEKYAASGQELILELETVRAGGGAKGLARLSVSDRGPGIPAECAGHIFEEFYRAHDSLDSGVSGAGLGLSLARKLARAHQGDLRHVPRSGGGSVFILEIPLA
ncbi:MAG TPA: HAMP domain-containing sensor histidine kinase [Verrucomicrobiota bacterium]|nr:hypothetical protein [Verrucomicrobiales bacterium]HRI11696.1 HAMP domain-containing sensor histidine kinase [Verrucomicrobiota bacterium]